MKVIILALSFFYIAASAFMTTTIDPCSCKPYPGTNETLCQKKGYEYWTYDDDKKDCIGYIGYCVHGYNAFESIEECELKCKYKNIDPCKDVSYSGRHNLMIGSVYWTYDQDKNDCFGYRALNPKSYNLFYSLNDCENKCKVQPKEEEEEDYGDDYD